MGSDGHDKPKKIISYSRDSLLNIRSGISTSKLPDGVDQSFIRDLEETVYENEKRSSAWSFPQPAASPFRQAKPNIPGQAPIRSRLVDDGTLNDESPPHERMNSGRTSNWRAEGGSRNLDERGEHWGGQARARPAPGREREVERERERVPERERERLPERAREPDMRGRRWDEGKANHDNWRQPQPSPVRDDKWGQDKGDRRQPPTRTSRWEEPSGWEAKKREFGNREGGDACKRQEFHRECGGRRGEPEWMDDGPARPSSPQPNTKSAGPPARMSAAEFERERQRQQETWRKEAQPRTEADEVDALLAGMAHGQHDGQPGGGETAMPGGKSRWGFSLEHDDGGARPPPPPEHTMPPEEVHGVKMSFEQLALATSRPDPTPATRPLPFVPPGTAVTLDELERSLQVTRVEPPPGVGVSRGPLVVNNEASNLLKSVLKVSSPIVPASGPSPRADGSAPPPDGNPGAPGWHPPGPPPPGFAPLPPAPPALSTLFPNIGAPLPGPPGLPGPTGTIPIGFPSNPPPPLTDMPILPPFNPPPLPGMPPAPGISGPPGLAPPSASPPGPFPPLVPPFLAVSAPAEPQDPSLPPGLAPPGLNVLAARPPGFTHPPGLAPPGLAPPPSSPPPATDGQPQEESTLAMSLPSATSNSAVPAVLSLDNPPAIPPGLPAVSAAQPGITRTPSQATFLQQLFASQPQLFTSQPQLFTSQPQAAVLFSSTSQAPPSSFPFGAASPNSSYPPAAAAPPSSYPPAAAAPPSSYPLAAPAPLSSYPPAAMPLSLYLPGAAPPPSYPPGATPPSSSYTPSATPPPSSYPPGAALPPSSHPAGAAPLPSSYPIGPAPPPSSYPLGPAAPPTSFPFSVGSNPQVSGPRATANTFSGTMRHPLFSSPGSFSGTNPLPSRLSEPNSQSLFPQSLPPHSLPAQSLPPQSLPTQPPSSQQPPAALPTGATASQPPTAVPLSSPFLLQALTDASVGSSAAGPAAAAAAQDPVSAPWLGASTAAATAPTVITTRPSTPPPNSNAPPQLTLTPPSMAPQLVAGVNSLLSPDGGFFTGLESPSLQSVVNHLLDEPKLSMMNDSVVEPPLLQSKGSLSLKADMLQPTSKPSVERGKTMQGSSFSALQDNPLSSIWATSLTPRIPINASGGFPSLAGSGQGSLLSQLSATSSHSRTLDGVTTASLLGGGNVSGAATTPTALADLLRQSGAVAAANKAVPNSGPLSAVASQLMAAPPSSTAPNPADRRALQEQGMALLSQLLSKKQGPTVPAPTALPTNASAQMQMSNLVHAQAGMQGLGQSQVPSLAQVSAQMQMHQASAQMQMHQASAQMQMHQASAQMQMHQASAQMQMHQASAQMQMHQAQQAQAQAQARLGVLGGMSASMALGGGMPPMSMSMGQSNGLLRLPGAQQQQAQGQDVSNWLQGLLSRQQAPSMHQSMGGGGTGLDAASLSGLQAGLVRQQMPALMAQGNPQGLQMSHVAPGGLGNMQMGGMPGGGAPQMAGGGHIPGMQLQRVGNTYVQQPSHGLPSGAGGLPGGYQTVQSVQQSYNLGGRPSAMQQLQQPGVPGLLQQMQQQPQYLQPSGLGGQPGNAATLAVAERLLASGQLSGLPQQLLQNTGPRVMTAQTSQQVQMLSSLQGQVGGAGTWGGGWVGK